MFDIWFSGHDFWTWIYQTESEETEPSHSCMDVTTVQETFSLSDNSSRFRNPIKEVLSDLQYQGQLRLTLRRVQYGQFVFLTVKWLAAVENIPNFDYLYVDDISRWFIVKVKKRYENFYPPPLPQIALTFRKRHSKTVLQKLHIDSFV